MLQSNQYFQNQTEKFQPKDFEAKYRKAKAKLALLELVPTNSQPSQAPRSSQIKNKGLVAETFDWDEEDVTSDDEEVHIRALMAISEESKLDVGKNHSRNGEWVGIDTRKNVTF